MNCEQLKQKVLSLAISGRLVEQDSNDEPASELLKRINPKAKIIKDENIPNGWCKCKLKDIVDYEQPTDYIVEDTNYSNSYKTPVLTAGKSFILGYTKENENIFSKVPVIIFDDFTTSSQYVDFYFKVKSSAMKILIPKRDINIKYAYYLIKINEIDGSQTHKRHWITKTSETIIPLPPLKEQERIVEKVNMIFEEIEAIEKSKKQYNSDAKLLLQKVLSLAISGRLVEQDSNDEPASELLKRITKEKQQLIKNGKIKKEKPLTPISPDEIPFDIPSSWQWVRLGEICNLYTGNSINETEKAIKYTNVKGIDYIGTKDVSFSNQITYNNGVNIPDNDISSFRIAKAGKILMCIEGGSAGRKIAILDKDVCFGNKLCCFDTYASSIDKYLYYFLQSKGFTDNFQENKQGIIGGVSINILKTLLFPLPPLKEQERIVKKIEQIMPLVEELRY